jgi:hypothetical protein
MMEGASTSERSVNFYQATRSKNPENSNLQLSGSLKCGESDLLSERPLAAPELAAWTQRTATYQSTAGLQGAAPM